MIDEMLARVMSQATDIRSTNYLNMVGEFASDVSDKPAGQMAFRASDSGRIRDEPDRGVSAPQPGSDRPTRSTEQRG